MSNNVKVSNADMSKGGPAAAVDCPAGIYQIISAGLPWGPHKSPTILIGNTVSGTQYRIGAKSFLNSIKENSCKELVIETTESTEFVKGVSFNFEATDWKVTMSLLVGDIKPAKKPPVAKK